jgi:integrase
MLKQVIHPKIVQERLGHALIAITLDTYSHTATGIQQEAAKSFDECHTNPYNNDSEKQLVSNLLAK